MHRLGLPLEYIHERRLYEEMLEPLVRGKLRWWETDGAVDRYQMEVFSRLGVRRTRKQSPIRV